MEDNERSVQRIENNFAHHLLRNGQVEKYEKLRGVGKTLAYLIHEVCPSSREKSLAMTKLEESIMWANSAIARNDGAGAAE